ncbi:MAG TPA: TOBE domain-containing protein [Solirubrobacteraceae bacterium]|jgi:molybdopterin-binding protein
MGGPEHRTANPDLVPGSSQLYWAVPYQQGDANVKLSARNQLTGTVSEIRRGEAIANVVLDVAGQRLVASITVEAVEELGLSEGGQVTAVIKASDVIIATD